jgi:hypothetical protein
MTALLLSTLLFAFPPDPFIRGDADNSGFVNGADGSYVYAWLYSGGPEPTCFDAADANTDYTIDLSDAIYIWTFAFSGGPPPSSPYPTCGLLGRDVCVCNCSC